MGEQELVVAAQRFAERAHEGQVDKAGRPYIGHPLRVMARVATPEQKMAAVLHDVIEDCKVTEQQLLAAGFPRAVVDAVKALTKLEDEPLEESMRRVARNPIALVVKRADVADNTDPERLALLCASEREQLIVKYAKTLKLLDGSQSAASDVTG